MTSDDLAQALDRVGRMMATDARDWARDRTDAWLYGLLCGWDCELDHAISDHVHDDLCGGTGVMIEVAEMHGWAQVTVDRLRRYRAAVREATANAPRLGQEVEYR